MRTDLLLVEGFLSPEVCRDLAAQRFTPRPGLKDQDAFLVHDPARTADIVHRVSEALREYYGITAPLFCDYAATSRLGPGEGHGEHADAERPDGSPNHTNWRVVTAMLYLNTCGVDFDGGQLEFTHLGEKVEPRAGLLVGFRCDGMHTHRVPEVTRGVRRALALWFTTDETYRGRVATLA